MGKNTVTSVVSESLEQVKRTLSDSSSTIQQKMNAVGSACTNIGASLLPVSSAATGLGIAVSSSAISFENSMAKVQTIAGKTAVSYKGDTKSMSAAIKALSSDTGIAAGEVAEATYSAISAGVETSKSVEFVANANALAVGGFTDMTTSVDVLTTAINAYGLQADDASMISDRLITTQNLGKTTVGELAGSIGRVIPTASAYGVSIDNLCASYVEMTKGGIATSEATTYMKSMLGELGDSGSTVGKILQEQTGKSFSELMASGASLGDVMDVLGQSVNNDSTAFAQLWSSQEAGTGALSILNAGCDEFNSVMDEMGNSTGAANKAWETMTDTSGHKLQVTMNNLKNAGIELGQSFLTTFGPAMEKACKALSDLCTWFSNLPGPIKNAITVILGIVAAAGPFLIFVGKVTTGISGVIGIVGKIAPAASGVLATVTKVSGGIGTVLKGLWGLIAANPVIAVIAAIIGAVVLLYNKCEWFRDGVNAIWDAIKTAFHLVWDGIVSFFTETIPNAWNAVVTFFQGIPEWWSGLWQSIGDFFSGIWQSIFDNPIVQAVVNGITSIWNTGKETLSGIWDGITSAASATWSKIKDGASTAWENTKQVVVSNASGLAEGAKASIDGLKNAASNAWSGIKSAASDAWSGIKDFVTHTAAGLKDSAVAAFNNMVSGIGNVLQNVGATVRDGFRSAIDYITSLPSQAITWGRDFIDGLVGGIKNGIGKIVDAVSGVASTIRSYLHFSVPDVGPLTDYESWMPDFIGGLANGIDANRKLVVQSVRDLTEDMTVAPAVMQQAPQLRNMGDERNLDERGTGINKLIQMCEKLMNQRESFNKNITAGYSSEELGEAVAKALCGMGVYLDKYPVGKIITPVVSEQMGKIDRRKT